MYPKHSLRSWGRLCIKFGGIYTDRLKGKHRGYGDTFYLDEVFAVTTRPVCRTIQINGKQHYLWRTVNQESLPRFIGYEATRERERGMRGPASRKFKSVRQAQRFLGTHAAVSNLFNLGRHLVRAQLYRDLRVSALNEWSRAVA
ncbi:MAG: hypothetical protein V7720_17200 [Halioglobus sp.]